MSGASSATRPAIRACSYDWTQQLDVTSHDAGSLHAQLTIGVTPEPAIDPCPLPVFASTCTIGAALDYELVLPCAAPCKLNGFSLPGEAPAPSCACDGAPDAASP
jgi:hypothetical protein